ncbi:sodium-independent sulfate anion transporter-like [Anopheles marshallii]|uniref:sodium-independent sulfate anion transporter-like n=1 Tax=Anopheles marshallii TaxID=1521116 RepID=UPI00237A4BB3|nr:sodium-independent sulfate anion transporter-like [Anopheles marshallii]
MVEEAEELRSLQQPARITTFQDDGKAAGSGRSCGSTGRWWNQLLKGCSPRRRLPILAWIRRYDGEDALSDLIAGITLGLTMIPQSIAYATIAGLPSQYGLYAAFMGSLVYVFCGTVREVSIGPTSLMSLLTLEYTAGRPHQYVIVLAFASGLVELAMGAFRLGFLVCFISVPVTSAFTSATALIIIGAQLGNLLGLPRLAGSDSGFFSTVWSILQRLRQTAFGDAALGFGCMAVLVALQHLPRLVPAARSRPLHRLLWYVSLARNALVVLFSTLLAHYLSTARGGVPFRLSGAVEPGIPTFEWPVRGVTVNNTTISFLEITTELGSGLLLVPLVAVLANVAIAKAFATDGVVDATQELIALGLCNVIGSCFRAMPTTGAFTRSAVSHASGVRTPMSGLYSALLTLLALGVLTPYFYYIPRATLAAVLITAVASMLDLAIVRRLPRPPASLADLFAWSVCFAVCLVRGVEVGLLCGMAVSLLEPLRHWVWPRADCTTVRGPPLTYRRVRPNLGLLYPGVDRLRSVVLAEARHCPPLPIVLDCERVVALDHSAVRSLRELADEVERLGATLMLQNVQPTWRQALQLHDTDHGLVFRSPEGNVPSVAQDPQVEQVVTQAR